MENEPQSASIEMKKRPTPPKFLEHQMVLGEAAREVWTLTGDANITPQCLLDSMTYQNLVRRLRKGTHLEVHAYDGSWYAEVLVRAVVDGEVQASFLRLVNFDDIARRNVDDYEIEAVGDPPLWRVVRKSDLHVMVNRLDSKLACLQWLEGEKKAA